LDGLGGQRVCVRRVQQPHPQDCPLLGSCLHHRRHRCVWYYTGRVTGSKLAHHQPDCAVGRLGR
jgi:hypothetical protein